MLREIPSLNVLDAILNTSMTFFEDESLIANEMPRIYS